MLTISSSWIWICLCTSAIWKSTSPAERKQRKKDNKQKEGGEGEERKDRVILNLSNVGQSYIHRAKKTMQLHRTDERRRRGVEGRGETMDRMRHLSWHRRSRRNPQQRRNQKKITEKCSTEWMKTQRVNQGVYWMFDTETKSFPCYQEFTALLLITHRNSTIKEIFRFYMFYLGTKTYALLQQNRGKHQSSQKLKK